MVPIKATPVKFAGAVYVAILPVPFAGKPILVLLFVQVNVSPPPEFAAKLMAGTVVPGQRTISVMAETTGVGFTVMVKLMGALTQEFKVAVADILPTNGEPVLFSGARNEPMLPDPLAPRPIEILELVQAKDSPPPVLAAKFTGPMVCPGHTAMLVTELKTGWGLIVTTKVLTGLTQPFLVAVTEIVPTNAAPVKFAGAE